jgi:hypothetical protein
VGDISVKEPRKETSIARNVNVDGRFSIVSDQKAEYATPLSSPSLARMFGSVARKNEGCDGEVRGVGGKRPMFTSLVRRNVIDDTISVDKQVISEDSCERGTDILEDLIDNEDIRDSQ